MIKDNFKNDVLFKYLLVSQDEGSKFILKHIIEDITHIKCQQIHILNPEMTIENINDKDMKLDILVKTNHNQYVNIEMQNSRLLPTHSCRFQVYAGSMLHKHAIPQDNDYTHISPFIQIIFVDDMSSDSLIEEYTYRTCNGKEILNPLSRIYLISLKYIQYLNKERLSILETICYIFENKIDNVILKIGNRQVIEIMEDKIKRFNEEDIVLHHMYIKRNLNKWASQQEKHDIYEEGKAEGEDNATIQNIIQLMNSLDKSIDNVMDLLNIPGEKREFYAVKIKGLL